MNQPQHALRFSTAAAELALRYASALTLSHIGAAVLAGAALWNAVPRTLLVPWLAAAAFAAALHGAAVWWRRRTQGGRYLLFIASVAAIAVVWGAAGLMLYSNSALHQAMLTVIIFTVSAVALLVLAAFARLYAFFLLLAVSPLLLRLAADGDAPHLVMSATGFMMALSMALLGYTLRNTLRSWFALRAQNQMLVDDLRLQKEAAEQANVAKSKFLAAASHDLRQPLHALSLFASALSERIRYPEVRKIVDNIMSSVAALESLFNSLLDISKLDAGALQPQWHNVRLQRILDRLENDYRPQASDKGLILSITAAGDLCVRSDPALLERMLRNLMTNAIRYTAHGGVELTLDTAPERVRIAVRDTGIGIAPQDLDQIFAEYVQLQNPERDRSKGLGLGLAIVKRLADMLDHPVRVDSEPGRGSVFEISVPRAADGSDIGARAPATAAPSLDGLSVLVVDDDSANREATQSLLQGWGCRVLCADALASAVKAFQQADAVHCVIADYRLREGCTGADVLNALESLHGEPLPALILTGDTGLAQKGRIGEQGYRLMQKPASPGRLRAFLMHVAR